MNESQLLIGAVDIGLAVDKDKWRRIRRKSRMWQKHDLHA